MATDAAAKRQVFGQFTMGFNGQVVVTTEGRPRRPASGTPRPTGARRARLESRRSERSTRYGRFLGLVALGSLVPGAGLMAAGRRYWGAFFLTLLFLTTVGIAAAAVLVPRDQLLAIAFDSRNVTIVAGIVAAIGAVWLLVAVASHRALEPAGLSFGKRLGGALVVVAATSLVLTPMAAGVQRALIHGDLIRAVGAPEDALSHTTPDLAGGNDAPADPWADKPRVNVLLLGGDGDVDREGIRPDSQILASINTRTGDTVLLSLPRNLQGVPFAPDSPLAQIYPDGFGFRNNDQEYLLNAVYQNVPAAHPEVFGGVTHPGADANKWAVEGALGIDVDYFVLVNLAGFKELVDALGGITIDVQKDIPIGGVGSPIYGYIEAGKNRHLDGYEALWFARSRVFSDDYDRMERQRCVIGAIVEAADPLTVFRRYQELAAATKDIVTTDIPASLMPAFAELALKVKDASVRSLPFTNQVIDPADPDYNRIHALVAEALEPAPTASPTASAAATATAPATPKTLQPSPGATVPPGQAADLDAVC